LAAVEDSLAPPPLPLPSGGWTFSLLPNSLQEDKDDEGEDERTDVAGTPTESLGKRILFRPDQIKKKKKLVFLPGDYLRTVNTLFLSHGFGGCVFIFNSDPPFADNFDCVFQLAD